MKIYLYGVLCKIISSFFLFFIVLNSPYALAEKKSDKLEVINLIDLKPAKEVERKFSTRNKPLSFGKAVKYTDFYISKLAKQGKQRCLKLQPEGFHRIYWETVLESDSKVNKLAEWCLATFWPDYDLDITVNHAKRINDGASFFRYQDALKHYAKEHDVPDFLTAAEYIFAAREDKKHKIKLFSNTNKSVKKRIATYWLRVHESYKEGSFNEYKFICRANYQFVKRSLNLSAGNQINRDYQQKVTELFSKTLGVTEDLTCQKILSTLYLEVLLGMSDDVEYLSQLIAIAKFALDIDKVETGNVFNGFHIELITTRIRYLYLLVGQADIYSKEVNKQLILIQDELYSEHKSLAIREFLFKSDLEGGRDLYYYSLLTLKEFSEAQKYLSIVQNNSETKKIENLLSSPFSESQVMEEPNYPVNRNLSLLQNILPDLVKYQLGSYEEKDDSKRKMLRKKWQSLYVIFNDMFDVIANDKWGQVFQDEVKARAYKLKATYKRKVSRTGWVVKSNFEKNIRPLYESCIEYGQKSNSPVIEECLLYLAYGLCSPIEGQEYFSRAFKVRKNISLKSYQAVSQECEYQL